MEQNGLSLNKNYHVHDYIKDKNFLRCKHCNKKILALENSTQEGLRIGKRSDGKNYSVRNDRKRYFFPNEWNAFIKLVNNKLHWLFFITALHSGGRIMEILNLRYKDIDDERGTITFSIVKQRKAKKNFFATGKSRSFFVSTEYINTYKSFIRGRKINKDDYIFLDNTKLPENYSQLENESRKKYYQSKVVSYSKMLKYYLKKAGIKDYYNFSPHNIRKTYGMWMRVYNKDVGELCYRMGHDMDTYLAHYGSSLIFTDDERRQIMKIIGDAR